jgi:hypothetical protein
VNAAVIKPKAPKSAAALQREVEALERTIAEAHRGDSIARSARPRLIVEGDAAAVGENQRTLDQCAATIARANEEKKHLHEALQLARQDERGAANARTYRELKASAATARQSLYALDDAILEFGKALQKAIADMEALESHMQRTGITPDLYQLRAKLEGIVGMALHLATAGMYGEQPTLLSEHELRQSGTASLKAQGREYETMSVTKIRGALGVRE